MSIAGYVELDWTVDADADADADAYADADADVDVALDVDLELLMLMLMLMLMLIDDDVVRAAIVLKIWKEGKEISEKREKKNSFNLKQP